MTDNIMSEIFADEKPRVPHRILFLDIDGVMNSRQSFRENNKRGVHRNHCDLPFETHMKELNRIVEETDCRIVISSTWRHYYSTMALRDIFYLCGMKRPEVIIDKTIDLVDKERSHEIQDYLDKHKGLVLTYVSIDDGVDACVQSNTFVKTDFEYGMTKKHADRAIKILNTAR